MQHFGVVGWGDINDSRSQGALEGIRPDKATWLCYGLPEWLSFSLPSPVVMDQRRDALGECLNTPPTSQRQLLELRYASGNTVEAIADSINRPAGSVRQTLYRIRLALQKCIEGKLVTEDELPNQQAFSALDVNGDNSITADEWNNAISAMTPKNQKSNFKVESASSLPCAG